MKAAWDRHLPRETERQRRRLVNFAHDCGFDTVIVPFRREDPASLATMTDRADALGMDVLGIVNPYPVDELREESSPSLQQVHPAERAFLEALRDHSGVYEHRRLANHWVPAVIGRDVLCFEDPHTLTTLKERVEAVLEVADGVAFDGFGFRNHYACFCESCRSRRVEHAELTGEEATAVLRATSEETLVKISEHLYDHAKSIDSDAIVTNHLWPPFRPNPYYGHRLKLDYCSQTISWYYRPTWSLERVEFEAAEHKRLETPSRNRFVPFLAMYDRPHLLRSPDRLTCELEIAVDYGDGHVVFSELQPLKRHEALRSAVRCALS